MWEHYLEGDDARINMVPFECNLTAYFGPTGQRDILEYLIAFARDKEELAIEEARNLGIDLVFDDDE